MSVGVPWMWPTVSLLAFLALTGVIVALGSSSTARYEFARNGARDEQRTAGARDRGAHPAGRRAAGGPAGAPDGESRLRPQAVGVAVRAADAPVVDVSGGPAWWLVVDGAQVVAGPFRDRVDAEWAALADGLAASTMYGVLRADGDVVRRPSPEDRAWLAELGENLDRLPKDWDAIVSDTDPLTTLVVEVAAALVEAGLPLHEPRQGPAGGLCLLPVPEQTAVLVSWRPHDRMSLLRARGAETDAAVQLVMNAAVADVLEQVGFVVEPFSDTGCHLVTAIRP